MRIKTRTLGIVVAVIVISLGLLIIYGLKTQCEDAAVYVPCVSK